MRKQRMKMLKLTQQKGVYDLEVKMFMVKNGILPEYKSQIEEMVKTVITKTICQRIYIFIYQLNIIKYEVKKWQKKKQEQHI